MVVDGYFSGQKDNKEEKRRVKTPGIDPIIIKHHTHSWNYTSKYKDNFS